MSRVASGPGSEPSRDRVLVHAPAKINLHLAAGPPGRDGYHPLTTVFQALSLYEEVTASAAVPGSGVSLTLSGVGVDVTPRDRTHLAVRAAHAVAQRLGRDADVAIHVHKQVPVAGGMAGGSADAAAALMACDLLWGGSLGTSALLEVARDLGADVPFALVGGTALGTDRGDRLAPVTARGQFHWVLALAHEGLSTPQVFAAMDGAREAGRAPRRDALDGGVPAALAAALAAGDPVALGAALSNDLQDPALALRPALGEVLLSAREAGALGAVVSGSGPTVAVLASGGDHAAELVRALGASSAVAETRQVHGPVAGAHQVSGAAVSPQHPSLRGR